MKEAVLKVQRADHFEDQLVSLEKSEAKVTKANLDNRVVKISISKTEEYKRSDWERRMHLWFMFRELRNEFDQIERDTIVQKFDIDYSKFWKT